MADEAFGILAAFGVQTALGTKNATIAGLTGALTLADGIVQGDRDSGDADSGISIPNLVAVRRARADVPASFTKRFGSFQSVDVTNFAITTQLTGNGKAVSATPAVGEAIPPAGYDALLRAGGLVGANGALDVEYDYTPRHAGSSGGATVYMTAKLWIGDLSFVLADCLVESIEIEFTPKGIALATYNIAVGSHDPAVDFADGVTLPTADFQEIADLSAPLIKNVGFAWGQTRGFRDLTVTIDNDVEDVPDSNQVTGIRKVQNSRRISVDGTLFIESADSDFAYQNLVATAAPTEDLSFNVGTKATLTGEIMNAYRLELNNLNAQDLKYGKAGTATVVELSGAEAQATTAGGEAKLQYR